MSFVQVPDRMLGMFHADAQKHFNRVMADCDDCELPKLIEAEHMAKLLANAFPAEVEAVFANFSAQLEK